MVVYYGSLAVPENCCLARGKESDEKKRKEKKKKGYLFTISYFFSM